MSDQQGSMGDLNKTAEISAFFRWSALFLMSFVVLATYLVYDSISPIGELIKQDLGISSARFGSLYSAYSIPNSFLFLTFFGGIFLDKWGTRLGGAIFAVLCLIGALLTSIGAEGNFWIMFLGRFIFGLGAETLIVAQNKIIAKWFRRRELSLAFAINLSICRLGTMLSYNVIPSLNNKLHSWSAALWVVTAVMALGVVVYILYCVIDRRVELRTGVYEDKPEHIDLKLILGLPKSFWYITMLCLTFYSAVFPFQQFAPQIFSARFGMDADYGSWITGLLILITMFVTPLFGWACDRFGKRATMMLIGSLALVPIHLSIGFLSGGTAPHPSSPMFDIGVIKWYDAFPLNGVDIVPILPIMLLGIVFSLVPAAMWPSVARMVEEKRLGTAYGLMSAIQNFGLFFVPLAIGWGELPSFVVGRLEPFQLSMLMVAFLGVLGAVFAILLKIADRTAPLSIEAPETRD
jgi:nitrate/nitrite transporter NarK